LLPFVTTKSTYPDFRKRSNTKNALDDARGRIDALGIIHRLLYQKDQERFTTVRISDYISRLQQQLLVTHDLRGREVEQDFKIENLDIEMDVAMHIGLVINELLQNSFKYAFQNNLAPKLRISFRAEGSNLLLTVRDNGPGFPSTTEAEENASFGLRLVRIILESRGGSFECYNDNGSVSHIKLPFNEGEVLE
jgi:two-component sensor histidine kinase